MPVRQSAPPIMIGSSALTAPMQTISPAESETAIVGNKLAVADAPARCFFGCFFGVATIFSSLATDLRFVGYLTTLGRNLRSLRALRVLSHQPRSQPEQTFQPRLGFSTYPAVTSPLWAATAPRTSVFSRFGKKSRVRPTSAATSSNSSGEIRRFRWASSRPSGVAPGLVAVNLYGPPETSQTQSVRINLRPGSRPRFLVCHSRSCGFLDFWPTIGFFTTASLKWSPPPRWRRRRPAARTDFLRRGLLGLRGHPIRPANAIGEALSASP